MCIDTTPYITAQLHRKQQKTGFTMCFRCAIILYNALYQCGLHYECIKECHRRNDTIKNPPADDLLESTSDAKPISKYSNALAR